MQETLGSIPGSGRSPGGGHGNSLQYSCLENPMDTGAWRATVMWSRRVGPNWATFTKHFHPEFKATYTSYKSLFLPQLLKQSRNGKAGISGRKKQWGSVQSTTWPLHPSHATAAPAEGTDSAHLSPEEIASPQEDIGRNKRVSWVTCQELTAPCLKPEPVTWTGCWNCGSQEVSWLQPNDGVPSLWLQSLPVGDISYWVDESPGEISLRGGERGWQFCLSSQTRRPQRKDTKGSLYTEPDSPDFGGRSSISARFSQKSLFWWNGQIPSALSCVCPLYVFI